MSELEHPEPAGAPTAAAVAKKKPWFPLVLGAQLPNVLPYQYPFT